ncbi:baculoviral IAP repeat-containing protein 2 isoform X1 [Biomphalaria glabrata]|nr:baculoviral IAP repeat-containing protein 2 isoform X1 [Biomphalaria glabrata]
MAKEKYLTSMKSNHADKLMPNGENENFERKGKDNLSQEKHVFSLYTFNRQDMIQDCKSKDREDLLHCLGHQHVKSEQELWKDLLSNGNFRLKPCNINVYIFGNIPKHPARLGKIQWSWLVEEIWRIRTFSNYPQNAAKSAILLASDGFAYVGNGRDVDDSVICFFCESVKNKWQPLEDICEVHKQLSPNCSMVTHINCPNIPLKTNHDSILFDKVFQIQKYHRNLNASENSIGIQDIEQDEEITSINRSNLPVSSQGVLEHHRSIAAPPSQSSRADDSSQSLSSAFPSVRESPSNAVSSVPTSVFNNTTPPPGNTVYTANNLVSDSSLVTDSATPSTNTAVPSTDTAAGHFSATASTVNQAVANSSQNATKGNAGGPTYSELGIVTERPKRFEYAVRLKRMETFTSWPRDHHLRLKELAEDGFYYAGYADCARCFYCSGGLRNWEDEDIVWVEHARWFPNCAYVRQKMGQVFVDIVQELNKTNDHITFKMVSEKMCAAASAFKVDNSLNYDHVIQQLVCMGFPISEVTAMAKAITVHGLKVLLTQGYELKYIYQMFVKYKINEKPSTNQLNQLGHPLHSSYTHVRTRLNTLQQYDDDPIRNKDIAKAGYFYKSEKKHLICHWCGKKIRALRRQENPFFEHARLVHDCGYINQLMGNFFVYFVKEAEINDDAASGIPDSASLYPTSFSHEANTTGTACPNYREQKSKGRIKARTSPENDEEDELDQELMRLVPCAVLENPQFSSTRSRRISFHGTVYEPLKHLLAKAGYFYDVSVGSMRCFCCGGEVKHFPDNVNIFIYHAQTFHECSYIMLAKDPYNSSHTSPNVDTGSAVQDESNKDIEQLPPEMLCKICYLQRRCICYFPCHHVICCIDCGFGVTTCQICESQVTFLKYVLI